MSFGVESYDLVFLTKGCEKAVKGSEAILYLDYL